MKKKLLLLFCFISMYAGAYEYLEIVSVNWWWWGEPGSIDKIEFQVKPKGLYAEVGMIMNFSTRGTYYEDPNDSLEIQMRFHLPEEAIVTDMWLWINDSAIVAQMFDRWTATQIYESIVQRRVDPALLRKDKATVYTFNIFPLLPDLPRQAKITFLVPIENLTTSTPYISLPINIPKLSYLEVDTTIIKFYPDMDMNNPVLLEDNTIEFTAQEDYYIATIDDIKNWSSLSLASYTDEDEDFMGIFPNKEEAQGFYQLELVPDDIFAINQNKKALFLIDFINANSTLTDPEVLDELKRSLLKSFTPSDSFNVFLSGMNTQVYFENWISGDSAAIEMAFDSISSNDINNYSGLPTLLMDGINYIQDRDNEGTIVLIASSNSNGDISSANSLINDFLEEMGSDEIPIHIIDLDDKYYSWSERHHIGGQEFLGNEYFYIHLSRRTVGEYLSIRVDDYISMLDQTSSHIGGYFSSMDIYVSLDVGYTYANYSLYSETGLIYFDQPIRQVGKYTGNFPLNIAASAQLPSGEFFYNEIEIDSSTFTSLDSTARTVWANQYINELYLQQQTNSVVNQIIYTSLSERILTTYTAFLALEPDFEIDEDPDELDDPEVEPLLDIIENKVEKDSIDFGLKNYPNPCTDYTTFSFYLAKPAKVKLVIYDVFGKQVAQVFDEEFVNGLNEFEYNIESLTKGLYIYILYVNDKNVASEKLLIN